MNKYITDLAQLLFEKTNLVFRTLYQTLYLPLIFDTHISGKFCSDVFLSADILHRFFKRTLVCAKRTSVFKRRDLGISP